MSSPEKVLNQLQYLIDISNETTGCFDTDLTTAVGSLIAGYIKECPHINTYRGSYRINNTGDKHLYDIICQDCSKVLSTVEENHVDIVGDLLCDLCGSNIRCDHSISDAIVSSIGDGTHVKQLKCITCGEILSTTIEECTDTDGDGKCGICGAEFGHDEEICSHSSTQMSYKSNQDGTHVRTQSCLLCGEQLSTEIVSCTKGTPTYISNGDGTHTVVTECKMCSYDFPSETVNCTDADGDEQCDVCGAKMYEGEYYTEKLGSLSKRKFFIVDDYLVCGGDTASLSNVAVGKSLTSSTGVSNTTITVVPIPDKATKIAITFGDSYTTQAEIVVFKGDIDNITDSLTSGMNILVDKQCSLDIMAGKYDYVIFNAYCPSISSKTQETQVGNKATVRFD